MTKSSGLNTRTRNLFTKHARDHGIKSLRYLMEPFEINEKVDIILNSTYQEGRPHRRYNGLSGVITERRGQSYVVNVKVGNKMKKIIAAPQHLRESVSA